MPATPAPDSKPDARPAPPAPANIEPEPPTVAPAPQPAATPKDNLNFDPMNLDIDLDNLAKPAAPETATPAAEVPKPDFMKSDDQSEIPDLNIETLDAISAPPAAETKTEEPSLDEFADLLPPMKPATSKPAAPAPPTDDFSDDLADLLPPMKPAAKPQPASKPAEPPAEDFSDDLADLLPPMKPGATKAPAAKPAPTKEPDPFAALDDTPLPPMKPSDELGGLDDDDTPLPPMKPKAPAGKESKDPFAALFSESDLGLGPSTGEGSKDPFANLDLDLDVLEVFPSDDQPAPPPAAKPAPGGKKQPPPADDNPFNIDNIIDLDSPVEDKPKGGKKPEKDPFDLDDLDIGKFKL